MRYVYLGARDTAPALKGATCDPVRRPNGKCVVGRGKQLVTFAGESAPRAVLRRRLRLSGGPDDVSEAAGTLAGPEGGDG